MNREELAALFTAACIARLDKSSVDFDTAFKWADEFLAYAAKQREPKACEHQWISDGEYTACSKCYVPKVKPEPPKPACEHKIRHGADTLGLVGECLECGEKKPEPPKPEREWVRHPDCMHPDSGWCSKCRLLNQDNPKPERVAETMWLQWGNPALFILLLEVWPWQKKCLLTVMF